MAASWFDLLSSVPHDTNAADGTVPGQKEYRVEYYYPCVLTPPLHGEQLIRIEALSSYCHNTVVVFVQRSRCGLLAACH